MSILTFRRRPEPAPAAATRCIDWAEGDTCPGELDAPDSAFQADAIDEGWTFTSLGILAMCLFFGIPLLAHVFVTIADAIPQ